MIYDIDTEPLGRAGANAPPPPVPVCAREPGVPQRGGAERRAGRARVPAWRGSCSRRCGVTMSTLPLDAVDVPMLWSTEPATSSVSRARAGRPTTSPGPRCSKFPVPSTCAFSTATTSSRASRISSAAAHPEARLAQARHGALRPTSWSRWRARLNWVTNDGRRCWPQHHAPARDQVERDDGTLIKTMGDGCWRPSTSDTRGDGARWRISGMRARRAYKCGRARMSASARSPTMTSAVIAAHIGVAHHGAGRAVRGAGLRDGARSGVRLGCRVRSARRARVLRVRPAGGRFTHVVADARGQAAGVQATPEQAA